MKRYPILILLTLSLLRLYGQGEKQLAEGTVSYITSQNIYVKFASPGLVLPGDTIFIRKDRALTPLFISESVSSTSSVGKAIGKIEVKVSDLVVVKIRISNKALKDKIVRNTEGLIVHSPDSIQSQIQKDVSSPKTDDQRMQKVSGRISASSFSSFSNSSAFNQRMRYTFSLAADHISGSKFSTDSYIIFTHKINHWADVQSNIFNALKIYSFSVNYDINDHLKVVAGRKINNRIASIGAIDGIQTEASLGKFTIGAVVGTNPDYTDYSFNRHLFEYGGYLSHDIKNKSGQLINSVAVFQQTNSGKTDRRFVYFQQDNSLVENLNLFISCELDLYSMRNGISQDTISLTSLYLSLRYRFSRKLSVYTSYDSRKNVIYYETFKNYLDQMLTDATRKGYQFRVNYIPSNFINSSVSGSYRFQKNDIHPMYNANGFLTFNQVPLISSVSFSANWLKTSYVDGLIYGVRINRDIIPSKLSSGIFYRLVDYNYPSTNMSSLQNMAEIELYWQINKKMSFSANYDGTFEKGNRYNTIYINLIKRF
jgi:hypothetical protein